MRYQVLACDYDGTIAEDGTVSASTLAALEKAAASGRKLLLVTGRELADLLRVFPGVAVFHWVVAENGGLLYNPSTREEKLLAPEPSAALVALLQEHGVPQVSVGRTIIATWHPYESAVLTSIRELGLELQVTFNKGAVMVLPSGVNKRSGLLAALDKLGVSPHNCVGVGDAENDHAFLAICECGVAVANALPAVKEAVDWVTTRHHGGGVEELIARLLDDDLRSLDARLRRHYIALGKFDDGTELAIAPYGPVILVAGSSGGGKSTATTGLLERLAEREYQVCIVDPEGDHEQFESAMVAGTPEQPPELEQVLRSLAHPRNHAVVNLLGVPLADRPQFFLGLLARVNETRATTGRPHWVVIDEAHHVLGEVFDPTPFVVPRELWSIVFVTVHPERLHRSLLERVDWVLAVGGDAAQTLAAFAGAVGKAAPRVSAAPEQPGQVLAWAPGERDARRVSMAAGQQTRRRHRRKYARGELGPDKSFYFRGPADKLNLRAQNLVVFNDIAAGVDDETWAFHLARGDYSSWVREAIKDEELAEGVARVEQAPSLSAADSRQRIRELIEASYTAPA